MNEIVKAELIIERIRARKGWKSGHREMQFGETTIGYYDSERKDEYFTIKYQGVEYSPMAVSHNLVLPDDISFTHFDLHKWLDEILEITESKVLHVAMNEIMVNGIKYRKVED